MSKKYIPSQAPRPEHSKNSLLPAVVSATVNAVVPPENPRLVLSATIRGKFPESSLNVIAIATPLFEHATALLEPNVTPTINDDVCPRNFNLNALVPLA